MDKNRLENLLKGVKLILEHQKKVEQLKGESFNLFSILRMETRENGTHSAFLGELLDPKGSHLKGTLFLQYFLDEIAEGSIDIDSAKVKLEKNIGKRNDRLKIGGRVDIYIWDRFMNSLCIENKIHADDQNVQIERYYNHNRGKNKVFYLNLDGSGPKPMSKGDLVEGEHYHIISYKKEILSWLKNCQKEATDSPILRESIKQYYILTKKLTATMDNINEKDLIDLILKNYEASEYINNNFQKARQTVAEDIRRNLADRLIKNLPEGYTISLGQDAFGKWSKIWMEADDLNKEEIKFGVENFGEGGHLNGNMFFGVFLPEEKAESYKSFRGGRKLNNWWANCHELTFEEGPINLGNVALISKLNSNLNMRNDFLNELVEQIKLLVEAEMPYAKKFEKEMISPVRSNSVVNIREKKGESFNKVLIRKHV